MVIQSEVNAFDWMIFRDMLILVQYSSLVPEQVAAEDKAEREDEEADAQDDYIDVEWQLEELFRCHLAAGFDVTQAPWEEETHEKKKDYTEWKQGQKEIVLTQLKQHGLAMARKEVCMH